MAKSIHDRREFMGLAGASVAASAIAQARWGQAFAAVAPLEPDLVVLNGRAYTVDPIVPQAEAFAVKADRFVAVGSSEEVRSLIGPRTQTLDAEQMTIVPGFIDAHMATWPSIWCSRHSSGRSDCSRVRILVQTSPTAR